MGGHDQDQVVTAYCRGHGQRNTGIATGGLYQCIARLYLAPRLGLRNHTERGPVLDGAGRVVPF